MNCQIIHDSIHERAGWTHEYALSLAGSLVGYGSLAVAGPWSEVSTLYEFYVAPEHRQHVFELFETLIVASKAKAIETQTNDIMLTAMLHTYAIDVKAESILFEDAFETAHRAEGANLRRATDQDTGACSRLHLHEDAEWVLDLNGEIVGTGGILYHYNRPYGDIYMRIAEPFRRRGLGALLVQELKAACRREDSVPAARCSVNNQASRRTLQNAGFVPCGNLIAGTVPAALRS